MSRFCTSCGAAVPSIAKYCVACGKENAATQSIAPNRQPQLETPRSISPLLIGALGAALIFGAAFAAYWMGQVKKDEVAANVVSAAATPVEVAPPHEQVAPSAAVPPVPTAARLDFGRYAQQLPFDGFSADQDVQKLTRAAVPDRALLDEMKNRPGPQTPILVAGKYLLAWGCEAHNCGGGYNWSIVVVNAKSGQFARVCIHDSARMGDFSDWYQNGRLKNRVTGECPSEIVGL
jgi:hypothetical protein